MFAKIFILCMCGFVFGSGGTRTGDYLRSWMSSLTPSKKMSEEGRRAAEKSLEARQKHVARKKKRNQDPLQKSSIRSDDDNSKSLESTSSNT